MAPSNHCADRTPTGGQSLSFRSGPLIGAKRKHATPAAPKATADPAPARRAASVRAAHSAQKKTPAPEGPGSVAGWVRGWGAGGTPPGVTLETREGGFRSK